LNLKPYIRLSGKDIKPGKIAGNGGGADEERKR
jgi:hypothetical protein